MTQDFSVFTWGSGSKGQLGPLGGKDGLTRPRLMMNLVGGHRINDVACGEVTSMFISFDEKRTLDNIMVELKPT